MIHLLEVLDLKKMLDKNEVILIDVREESEYKQSRIASSILIPLQEITIDKVKSLQKDNKKIALHCRSGTRSLKACQVLMEYDKDFEVYNVEGGIVAWQMLNNLNYED